MSFRPLFIASLAAIGLSVSGLAPVLAQTVKINPGLLKNLTLNKHPLTVAPKIDNSQLMKITACPDPAANLTVSDVQRSRDGITYKFNLNAVIRNAGRAAWQSNPRQQSAELVTQPPGGRQQVLAKRDFTRLNAGASISFSHSMTLAGDNEFPPGAALTIVYDPDIRADGNKANDDCRMGDNTLRISGTALLQRVRAAVR